MIGNSEKNLKNQRAEFAFDCIQNDLMVNHKSVLKEYRSQVQNSVFLIHRSGLLQVFTYYVSKMKKKKQLKILLVHLINWLLKDEILSPDWEMTNEKILEYFEKILKSSEEQRMIYTEETKYLLEWLKRFTDAIYEENQTQGNN